VLRSVTKSDNWPQILEWRSQLGTLLWSDSLPLQWEDETARSYYQKDSATARTARVSMMLLRDLFGERIMSKDICPPRSPDLTSPDIIYGKQWMTQFTKTILTFSFNWRKPSHHPSGTFLRLNCGVSLQTGLDMQMRVYRHVPTVSNVCCNSSKYVKGRATAQAVSRWLPTAAARVRARVWSGGICGGQSGAGAGFLRVLRFPMPIFIPPNSPSS
jgi:hypothetical protein